MPKKSTRATTAEPAAQSGQGEAAVAPASSGSAGQSQTPAATDQAITPDNIEQRLSALLQVGDQPPAAEAEPKPAEPASGQEPSPETAGESETETEQASAEAGEDETAAEGGDAGAGEAESQGEDETILPKGAQKRIDKLIAERSELRDQVETMRQELEDLKSKSEEAAPAAAPARGQTNPLDAVKSESVLSAKEAEAENLLDWVEDQLVTLRRNPEAVQRALRDQKIELKDAEGNDDYSRESMEEFLMKTRRNLDKTIRVHIPQRRQHLQAVAHYDAAAAKAFPFLTDRKAPEHAIAQEVIQHFPGVQQRPDWKVFVGVHTLGLIALRERQARAKNGSNGNGATVRKPVPAAPRATAATAIPAAADPRKVKVEAAREKMLKQGDPVDYIKEHLNLVSV